MVGQRLLSDLEQLAIGDCFTVRVLNKKLTYKVDQLKKVLPENVSNLTLNPEQDHVAQVTCTPYGITIVLVDYPDSTYLYQKIQIVIYISVAGWLGVNVVCFKWIKSFEARL